MLVFGPVVRTTYLLRSVGASPEIYSTRSVINRVHKWYCETNNQNHMGYVISVKRFPFASFGSRFYTNQALVTKWYEDI